MMTYLRDDIVQVYPPGPLISAQAEPDNNHTPYFGAPPLLMMTTSLLRSFLSFKSLYAQMNLVWTFLFLTFPSHCLGQAAYRHSPVSHCLGHAAYRPSPVSWFPVTCVTCTSLHFCALLCVCAPEYRRQRLVFGISLGGSVFHEAQGTIDAWLEWQFKSSRGLLVCMQHLTFYLGAKI